MLHAIASAFAGVALFISSLFGVAPSPAPVQAPVEESLGTSLPSGTAVFETSLQSRISSTDTSLTLVANSVRGGSTLSGYNCFTIDEGRTDAEYVCGTVSGTSVTSLTRGVDPSTGTTSNSALKFAHRVGANVKITDFPLLQILRNQASGTDTYSNVLTYASGIAPAGTGDLTDKEYVDSLAFSGAGVIDASTVAKGVVELATGCEAASSTSAGSSGNLAIPASLASSTRTSASLSACKVVAANNSGVIDDNYIATSTLFATSSIAKGPIGMVGKNAQAFTSTGTTTFSVPTGIQKIKVTTVGAGGGGGGVDPASTDESGGGGGGGGACAIEWIDVSGTSTIQVFVGTGGPGGLTTPTTGTAGTWSTFGTNGFYNSAAGGNGGGADTAPLGGLGGAASGGTLNITGQGGGGGSPNFAGTGSVGAGGNSCMGGGGAALSVVAGTTGIAGGNYGGGGGGAPGANGTANAGGAGANGLVLVEW